MSTSLSLETWREEDGLILGEEYVFITWPNLGLASHNRDHLNVHSYYNGELGTFKGSGEDRWLTGVLVTGSWQVS